MAYQPHTRSRSEGEAAPLGDGARTIAAVATPPGRGGIGVVRVSGRDAATISQGISGAVPEARVATLSRFVADDGALIDEGLSLFFPGPHSYTGEDVLELQAHGGPMVMAQLLQRCVDLGARLALPGEFTLRAFLNDRIDLAQAEGVADLIDAASVEAARSAARSMDGEFSRRVQALVEALIELRMHVEASIDFPEEEIAPADRAQQELKLQAVLSRLGALRDEAHQGVVLRDGFVVALIGAPNVGKSSLLNRLSGQDLAIVTPIAGTTRDSIRATISLQGVPVHLIDTAGLRETENEIERIGIERTWSAIGEAGAALYITEPREALGAVETAHLARLPSGLAVAHVVNKIDLSGETPGLADESGGPCLRVSAKTGAGLDALRGWLLKAAGYRATAEGVFMARTRHLEALSEAEAHLIANQGLSQPIELEAENLRLAQKSLQRVSGVYAADDLLGAIFSRFCIGK